VSAAGRMVLAKGRDENVAEALIKEDCGEGRGRAEDKHKKQGATKLASELVFRKKRTVTSHKIPGQGGGP